MGIQDRDWWKEESRRRQAQDKPSRGRRVVDVDPGAAVRKTARTGALWITVFWLAILAVTYAGFT